MIVPRGRLNEKLTYHHHYHNDGNDGGHDGHQDSFDDDDGGGVCVDDVDDDDGGCYGCLQGSLSECSLRHHQTYDFLHL